MVDEQLEFQITQYVDGTLPPEERAGLKGELERNGAARQILEAYRKLAGAMAALPAMPAMDWDQLQERIATAVRAQPLETGDQADTGKEARSYRMPWVGAVSWARPGGWLAMAACLLIVVGLAFQLMHVTTPKQAASPAGALVQVTGPRAEQADGPVVAQVSIGPAPALANRSDLPMYGDNVLNSPSQLVIASGPETVQDIEQFY